VDTANAEKIILASNRRAQRVRGAIAAVYLRGGNQFAIRGLTAVTQIVFFRSAFEENWAPRYWASFDPPEKLLFRIAFGLYRQCIQTGYRHLLKRVRLYVKELSR
jgi:hypothetical protein